MPIDSTDIMSQSIAATTFVVVDVETTGLSPRDGRITEIAMIKVRNGMLWEEYTTLVNPLMPIPDEVTALTGIDDAMVADAPAADEVAPAIAEFLGDGVFTAHNAPFDLGFVNSTLAKGKFERIQNPVLCTCKLARRLLPNLYQQVARSGSQTAGDSKHAAPPGRWRCVCDCSSVDPILTQAGRRV